ncbi:hypothetical protein KC19_VG003600 [Ceratodon purpureus]|uniref:Uncharacterized protein n=1 Tax=Ceratodon purpureus TaxID=3225 RepID=A0A8T0HKQ1_CERPU|nr:hypothetical protein KC19_VG003600 [Ceratodon purpureus]
MVSNRQRDLAETPRNRQTLLTMFHPWRTNRAVKSAFQFHPRAQLGPSS